MLKSSLCDYSAMLKSSLCDYSDAYILVKGTIISSSTRKR